MRARCDVDGCGRVHRLAAYTTDADASVVLCAYHREEARAGVALALVDGARIVVAVDPAGPAPVDFTREEDRRAAD